MGTQVSFSERRSSNPESKEKAPVSTNPTDCSSKEPNSWCRSGKDEQTIKEAISAQAPRIDGPLIRFGGLHGKNAKHSALKPSGDKTNLDPAPNN